MDNGTANPDAAAVRTAAGRADAASTQTYLALITHPDAGRDELADLLAISRPDVDQRLADLAQQGSLLMHADGSWHVPPPDITLPARASS